MYSLILLPEWDCETCTAAQKVARGCEAPARQRLELDGEVVTRCPRRPLLDTPQWLDELFWLYSNYTKGILPDGGTLLTNPAKLVDAFRVLSGAIALAETERDERERRQRAMRQRMQAAYNGQIGQGGAGG